METTLVFLPESSRRSNINAWSTKPREIRARQIAEQVMTETSDVASSSSTPAPTSPARKKLGHILSCYKTHDGCLTATGNCSGRGDCVNRYLRQDGSSVGDACFVCLCDKRTYWAGSACQKIDVSVPFWLFAGFTVVIIGALTAAIGMLFSVGEEQLPGVIGAGVKSK